jgi:oxidase EvaA
MTEAEIEAWRKTQLKKSGFCVQRATLEQLPDWSLTDGSITHSTGGFFSIVGLEIPSECSGGSLRYQPFIHQPEIGILGILVTEREGKKQMLVQAKTEPGNPCGIQLAPTFQCTRSNYTCRHGGLRAPFYAFFSGFGQRNSLCNSLQSEQGSRFVGKFNRNIMVEVEENDIDLEAPSCSAWRWMSVKNISHLISNDFLFNTDFRSVLATSDWSILVDGGVPFAVFKDRNGIGPALYESYHRSPDSRRIAQLISWLESGKSADNYDASLIPLTEMKDWKVESEGIYRSDKRFVAVRYYLVTARDREVPEWSQPLVTSEVPGINPLVMRERKGVMHLLAHLSREPGFGQRCQISLPFQQFPGERNSTAQRHLDICMASSDILVDCLQSEEGGRFFHERNRYLLLRLNAELDLDRPEEYEWLTLAEINELKTGKGVFTNEFRSALTLLMKYL